MAYNQPPPYYQYPQGGHPPPQSQPAYYPADALPAKMGGMSLQPRAGDSPLLSQFAEGNVVIMQSKASGRSLRLHNGQVQGTGGRGQFAQLRVHVRRPGVVALQSIADAEKWLAVHQGVTHGSGRGGQFGEFYVKEIEGQYVCLESVQYPGQHVGILPDGCLKPPGNTGTGAHGRFIPSVHSTAPPPPTPAAAAPSAPPPSSSYPQPTYPQPPPPQTTPYQQPGYGYPTGQALPPPQQQPPPAGYFPPATQPPPPPAGPQMPIGFNVMDAFLSGNVVYLVARGNGYPLRIHSASVTANGSFTATDSQFTVVTPPNAQPGVISFQNINWAGCYIAIIKGRIAGNGKGGKFCHFRPHVLPDNYVAFQSVEYPGQYLTFTGSSQAGSPQTAGANDKEAQFFIRMERQKSLRTTTVMTPFGRPSIANQLQDRCTIQLYLKSNATYLSINSAGNIANTNNAADKHTFFQLMDRGMGIYSLQSYLYPGYRIRMANHVLQAKGDPDLNADFRLKENADGTAVFESVSCAGSHIGINSRRAGMQTGLSVFLVTIQKFGRSDTITKTPLN